MTLPVYLGIRGIIRLIMKTPEKNNFNANGKRSKEIYGCCSVIQSFDLPIDPVKAAGAQCIKMPAKLKAMPRNTTIMAKIVTRHEDTVGIRVVRSKGPAVVTLTFWRYSSTMASMSVEVSESELSNLSGYSKSEGCEIKLQNSSINTLVVWTCI